MNTKSVNFKPVGILPLLKSSKETNFIYEIENLTLNEKKLSELNLINIYQKIDSIYSDGGLVKFINVESDLFKNNLILVDSLIPSILGETILQSYRSKNFQLLSVLDEIEKFNPLKIIEFDNIKFYTYKIKELLKHLILGMESSIVWHGVPNIYEHYPIIKNNDEIIYYTDNINIFIDIIIKNTLINPFSSNDKKYKSIYSKDGKWYLKLNLQLCYK